MKASVVLPLILFFAVNAQAAIAPPLPDYTPDKVSKAIWVIHGPLGMPSAKNQGFMNNPGIVLTDKGVVIIDPGSSLQAGEMVLRALKKLSNQPVVAAFNTHIHGDHWLGNQAIKAAYPKAKIYGHPKMIQAVKDGEGDSWVSLMENMTQGATTGTKVIAPAYAVNHGDKITIGNTQFKIHHYGHNHTHTDIMIEVIEEKTVFLGDNVLAQRIPRMSDGNFKGSMHAIDEVIKTDATVWVPGHGKTNGKSILKDFHSYLSEVYKTAQKAFNDDLDSSDVKPLLLNATAKYKNWSGYEGEIGKHGAQAYSEVEAAEF